MNAIGQRAEKFGVVVEQAEDEIAAINLAIGASYAGVRAMTGSSGGGFALMVEALGLAGCSETPLVILESQRPGPSTGLPTRTEQGDLSFVLSAGQGDFPRAVLAPGTPAQGFALTARAFNLADRYQLPVIVHHGSIFRGYQFHPRAGGFSRSSRDRPGPGHRPGRRRLRTLCPDRQTASRPGASRASARWWWPIPMNTRLTATSPRIWRCGSQMHDKRLRKLAGLADGAGRHHHLGPDDAPLTLACWGSSLGPVAEAVARLNAESTPARMVHFSELWPFPAAGGGQVPGTPPKAGDGGDERHRAV